MRVGVFTPLLSQHGLRDILKKLKGHGIDTVELGTGNYVGNAHCNLSMLDDKAALADFKKTLELRPDLQQPREALQQLGVKP